MSSSPPNPIYSDAFSSFQAIDFSSHFLTQTSSVFLILVVACWSRSSKQNQPFSPCWLALFVLFSETQLVCLSLVVQASECNQFEQKYHHSVPLLLSLSEFASSFRFHLAFDANSLFLVSSFPSTSSFHSPSRSSIAAPMLSPLSVVVCFPVPFCLSLHTIACLSFACLHFSCFVHTTIGSSLSGPAVARVSLGVVHTSCRFLVH
jgi:hypothetical protein